MFSWVLGVLMPFSAPQNTKVKRSPTAQMGKGWSISDRATAEKPLDPKTDPVF